MVNYDKTMKVWLEVLVSLTVIYNNSINNSGVDLHYLFILMMSVHWL